MKTLDRYITKSFLIGYGIAFCVLIGLRIIIDLFVNIDEFTEHVELGTVAVVRNIVTFYGLNTTLYFRDFAGIITVLAAVFSLGKMVRANEFVAMMASGVSLKRVIAPIMVLAALLTGLLVIDQELIIPAISEKLVRDKDVVPGRESYAVRFITDGRGSVIFAQRFDVGTSTLYNPTILLRRKMPDMPVWQFAARITALRATYNYETGKWDLLNGRIMARGSAEGMRPIASYASDITPRDIPLRRRSEYKTLLSWSQLAGLAKQGAKIRDLAQLYSQKHFRVTDPIINLAMLLVCLPILVCRDPKAMKSAVAISFSVVGVFLVTTFLCKMLATEVVFYKARPEFWAWLPVFLFVPAAFIALDSMKT
jgi:lipopolysaccharide export system permease protein